MSGAGLDFNNAERLALPRDEIKVAADPIGRPSSRDHCIPVPH
jgi:hypothetical protein